MQQTLDQVLANSVTRITVIVGKFRIWATIISLALRYTPSMTSKMQAVEDTNMVEKVGT